MCPAFESMMLGRSIYMASCFCDYDFTSMAPSGAEGSCWYAEYALVDSYIIIAH
jgi:hypothetical protein